VQGASENVLSADNVGSPGKLKVVHSSPDIQSVLRHRLLWKRNVEQRLFIYYCYVVKTHTKYCRRKFRFTFSDTACPFGDTISKLAKKVRTNGILIDRKP
jgi:hypothetical protein